MQDKYEIKISIKAKNDLTSIIRYIKNELQEPSIANKYFQLIKKEIKSLEYLPQKYAIIDDDFIKDLNLRKLIIKNYIVFYRINEDKKMVNIDRILYGESNWLNKL